MLLQDWPALLIALLAALQSIDEIEAQLLPRQRALDAFDPAVCGQSVSSWPSTEEKGLRRGRRRRQVIVTRGKPERGHTIERDHPDRLTPHLLARAATDSKDQSTLHSALPGEAPWYVSLQTYFLHHNDLRRPRCAGTLIHSDIVLTAAHCLKRGKYLATGDSYATLGAYDWRRNETVEKVPFERMCLPASYTSSWSRNFSMRGNDFALVKLARPVTFNQYIKPACMHDLGACRDTSKKRHCKSAGFGHQLNGYRPARLATTSMRTCWLDELRPHRSDEMCFVGTESEARNLDLVDRGSGIYCNDREDNRTYVLGVSTVKMQPLETLCCSEKPQQTYYTSLFSSRRELVELFKLCLGVMIP